MGLTDVGLILADELSIAHNTATTDIYGTGLGLNRKLKTVADDGYEEFGQAYVDLGIGLPPLYIVTRVSTALAGGTATIVLLSYDIDGGSELTSDGATNPITIATITATAGTRGAEFTHTLSPGDITARTVGIRVEKSAAITAGAIDCYVVRSTKHRNEYPVEINRGRTA